MIMMIGIIFIGALMLLIGAPGLILSFFMYGDIALAAGIGSLVSIFSGLGFILTAINIKISTQK